MSSPSGYTQLNPYTATRQQFTDNLTSVPIPANACKDWKDTAQKLQSILRSLAYHEAMAPNLQQTFMTPANAKNRVYFMWDFVGRTLGYLYMLPPDVSIQDTTDKRARELWTDIMGRNVMAGGLIVDDKPGFLNGMTEAAYPGQAGAHPEFGDEILEEGRRLFKSDAN